MNSQIVLVREIFKSKLAFFLVTAFIPVSLFLDAGFVSVAVIWFLFFCLFNYPPFLGDRFSGRKLLFLPLAYFFMHVIWLVSSQDGEAFMIFTKQIHLLLIPLSFLIVSKRITEKDFKWILLAFLIACIVCSLLCVAHAIFNVIRFKSATYQEGGVDYYYFSGYLLSAPLKIDPVYLCMFITLGYAVNFVHSLADKPIVKFATAAYLAVFIMLLSSKTGIASIILVTIVWAVKARARKATIYVIFGLMIVSEFFLLTSAGDFSKKDLPLYTFRYMNENRHFSPQPVNYFSLWSMGLETIQQNPLWGYGTEGAQKALESTFRERGFEAGIKDSLNPHNQFLSTHLEFGLIGICALLAMLIFPFLKAIRLKNYFAICFLLIICCFFSTESILERQKGIVFFSFFFSLLCCQPPNKNVFTDSAK